MRRNLRLRNARAGSALVALLVLLGGLGTALAPAAGAHTALLRSDPANGATVGSSPAQIVLTFNEPIQSSTLQLAVTNSAGETVSKTPPSTAGTVVTQPLPPLANDTYTVAYRIVSVDGHPVTETISFVLADPGSTVSAQPSDSGAASPDGSAASSPAVISTPTPSADQGTGGIGWKIGAGAAILLVLVLLYASISRSRAGSLMRSRGARAGREEPPTESPDRRGHG